MRLVRCRSLHHELGIVAELPWTLDRTVTLSCCTASWPSAGLQGTRTTRRSFCSFLPACIDCLQLVLLRPGGPQHETKNRAAFDPDGGVPSPLASKPLGA